jgi:hypothetical protein
MITPTVTRVGGRAGSLLGDDPVVVTGVACLVEDAPPDAGVDVHHRGEPSAFEVRVPFLGQLRIAARRLRRRIRP